VSNKAIHPPYNLMNKAASSQAYFGVLPKPIRG
jgi:hypothetical protein